MFTVDMLSKLWETFNRALIFLIFATILLITLHLKRRTTRKPNDSHIFESIQPENSSLTSILQEVYIIGTIPARHLFPEYRVDSILDFLISRLERPELKTRVTVLSRDLPENTSIGRLSDYEQLFRKRFKGRFYVFTTLIMAVTSLLVVNAYLEYRYQMYFPMRVYGLVLDGLGAILLAKGLFRGPSQLLIDSGFPAYVQSETPSESDRSAEERSLYIMVESTIRDTLNGMWGATFLVYGFFLQILAIFIGLL